METELSKVLASGGSEAQQKYLVDLAIDSELAENDLQRLPLQDEVKHYTTKLVNQIGDYSKYLNEKLANGGTVTAEEKESLRALYEALSSLKKSLNEMSRQMGDDFDFSSLKDAGEGNFMYDGFTELENMSVNFPELIYDGPFSEAPYEYTDTEAKFSFSDIAASYGSDNFDTVYAICVGDTGVNLTVTGMKVTNCNITAPVQTEETAAEAETEAQAEEETEAETEAETQEEDAEDEAEIEEAAVEEESEAETEETTETEATTAAETTVKETTAEETSATELTRPNAAEIAANAPNGDSIAPIIIIIVVVVVVAAAAIVIIIMMIKKNKGKYY